METSKMDLEQICDNMQHTLDKHGHDIWHTTIGNKPCTSMIVTSRIDRH